MRFFQYSLLIQISLVLQFIVLAVAIPLFIFQVKEIVKSYKSSSKNRKVSE